MLRDVRAILRNNLNLMHLLEIAGNEQGKSKQRGERVIVIML